MFGFGGSRDAESIFRECEPDSKEMTSGKLWGMTLAVWWREMDGCWLQIEDSTVHSRGTVRCKRDYFSC